MVQIGNFHLGAAQTAKPPVLSSGEAYMLWDMLISRYDAVMLNQIFQNVAHDPEFRILLTEGLGDILEKQVNKLEKELNMYKIALPLRPPKSVNFEAQSGIFRDEFLFRRIFTSIQNFLDNHVRTIRTMVFNDPLRQMFIQYTLDEVDVFNKLCKFGKMKGWLTTPPMSRQDF